MLMTLAAKAFRNAKGIFIIFSVKKNSSKENKKIARTDREKDIKPNAIKRFASETKAGEHKSFNSRQFRA